MELDKLTGVLEQLCLFLFFFFFLNLMRPNILSQPGAQDLQLKLSPVNEAFPVCLTYGIKEELRHVSISLI